MKFSNLINRVSGEGADAWQIYYAANAAKKAGRDVINLCIGDPNFDAPAVATEAAINALRAGDTHYADIPGRPSLRAAIAADFQLRSGVPTKSENAIFFAGAQNALYAVCQCLFQEGDEVLVPEPTYVTYEATIQACGAKIVRVPSPARGAFHLDLAALAAALTPRTRGIVFCNPNNPTGVVMTRAEIEAIAALARKQDLWVVSDEVYGGITFERPHISIAAFEGMSERTATISSLAKSHAMPGFRAGWVIGLDGKIECTVTEFCTSPRCSPAAELPATISSGPPAAKAAPPRVAARAAPAPGRGRPVRWGRAARPAPPATAAATTRPVAAAAATTAAAAAG